MTHKSRGITTSAKSKFVGGLAMLIVLLYSSLLGHEQVAAYEVAFLLAATLGALVFDYRKLGQVSSGFNQRRQNQCPPDRAIRSAIEATLKWPLLIKLVGTESLTLYYAFFARAEHIDVGEKDRFFSYTKSANACDVFLFVALSQLPFLPFVHILLEQYKGPGPAWAFSLLTLWSVIWYLAQVEAVRFRPLELADDRLRYRFGLIWKADIPLADIKSARVMEPGEEAEQKGVFLSPFGSKRNVWLEFESPILFSGPYLLRRRKRKAAIALDEPSRFLRQLTDRGVASLQQD